MYLKFNFRFSLVLIGLIFHCTSIAQTTYDVEIHRDSMGLAHIHGKTHRDMVNGLAYAHAEDNFKGIERMLILSRSRLGELMGKQGAVSDFFVHYLDARNIVDSLMKTQVDRDYLALLQAYCDGLNHYAAKHPKEVSLKNIFPAQPKDLLTAYMVIFSAMTGTATALTHILNGTPDDYIFNPGIGSNAAAISKTKSAEGKTCLFINPHVPLDGPLSFYEVHMMSDEGFNFQGAMFPGMISPAMGCSPQHGWGLTFNWPDYLDIHRLETKQEKGIYYRFDNEWRKLATRKVKLKVKMGFLKLSIHKKTYYSVYGPVMKSKHGYFATQINAVQDVRAPLQLFEMAQAKNHAQFYKAVQRNAMPLFNIVYANSNDTIFYLFNGRLPKRKPGFNYQKTLPGNTSSTLWEGFYKTTELPQVIAPDCGFVYNTNNTPFRSSCETAAPSPALFDTLSAWNWNRINCRDLRFRELIESKEKFTFNEFKAIKYDYRYPKTKGGIHKTIEPLLKLSPLEHPDLKDEIALANAWDMTAGIENRSAALILMTFQHVQEKIKAGYNEMETGFEYDTLTLVKSLKKASSELRKTHGRIDVPLGDVQKVSRGKRSFSASGMPDGLNSAYSIYTGKKGLREVVNGDTFIMFWSFGNNEVHCESVVPYGVSSHPESPYYNNQLELYAQQKTKRVEFDLLSIKKSALRSYKP
jgi:acyl-homoserine-lactone acylase